MQKLKFGVVEKGVKRDTSLVFGKYEMVGEDQGIPFSEVANITAYVPCGVPSDDKMVGTLVAADLQAVDERHLGRMQSREMDDHNVSHDVPANFRSVADRKSTRLNSSH